jgi:hypothetical protein
VASQKIPNTKNAYKYLSKVLVRARERGDVDYRRIEDRIRTTVGGDFGYNDPDEFLKDNIKDLLGSWERYTRAMWKDQPEYIELWVEKDALSRLVSGVGKGYNVLTATARGYSSFSFVVEAVPRFDGEKANTILYFGDYDPSGVDMVRDLGDRLQRYGATEVKIEKVALTYDQIQKYNLPPVPTKSTDTRSKSFIEKYGDQCVELDALDPIVLQGIIEKAIIDHIDRDLWNGTITQAGEEQEELKEKLSRVAMLLEEGTENDY